MNKKRVLIYSIGIIVFVVLITIRQAQIRYARNQPIVSTYSQWQQNGKPVVVEGIRPQDTSLFTKITLQPIDDKTFEGYVPRAIQTFLRVDQDVHIIYNGNKILGSVNKVNEEISFDTGMYRVQVNFKEAVVTQEGVVAYVHTDTLEDVICIPNNIIEREDGKMYVWKVENRHAVKQYIIIGKRDGYGAVVLKGLREGDIIVYKGFTQLCENDLIDVIESLENSGEQL